MSGSPETAEGRAISLRLGTDSYPIVTRLDEASYHRVETLVRDAFAASPRTMPQDQRLVLACLRLGLALDRMAENLGPLLEEKS